MDEQIKDTDNNVSSEITFLGVLLIVFIVLKLTRVISWSWLWVLSPVWLPIAFVLVITLIKFALVFIWLHFIIKLLDKRRK